MIIKWDFKEEALQQTNQNLLQEALNISKLSTSHLNKI
jgi:hypothetical protein